MKILKNKNVEKLKPILKIKHKIYIFKGQASFHHTYVEAAKKQSSRARPQKKHVHCKC